jgi:translation machinery-associated protein 16
MAPSPKTTVAKAKAKQEKKEKLFHPQSRKASQLERTQLRKTKLATAASKKVKKESAKSECSEFVYSCSFS